MLQPDNRPPQEPPEAVPLRPLDGFEGSLASRTYQALREAILTLRYQPGQPIRKQDVCEELGVSRSPVSEAMSRLASEGLVDVVPHAGTYVARFSMDDIREGAFLREAIELAAIEAVAPTITDDQLRRLRRNLRIQGVMLEDGDMDGFYELDAEFHEMILAFTGYRHLAKVAETAWVNVNRARKLVLPVPGRVAETLAEHEAILVALADRDAGRARSAMRRHLRQLMTFLAPLENEHPDFFVRS